MLLSQTVNAKETYKFDKGNNFTKNINKNHKNKVLNDLENMESIGIQTDNIISYQVDTDESISYSYSVTNEISSTISLDEDADGNLTIDIVEDSLHNILVFSDDGRLYLDGEEVTISESIVEAPLPIEFDENITDNILLEESPENRLSANGYDYIYTKTPPRGTYASDYTIYQGVTTVNSVKMQQKYRYITITALGLVLSFALNSCVWIAGAVSGILLNEIAGELKTLGERACPDAAFFSYRLYKYGTNKSQQGLWTYTDFNGRFYVYENCAGSSTFGRIYEYKYFY